MLIDRIADRLRDVRFRGKVRIATRLVAPKGARRARVFGADMTLDLSNFIDRQIYLGCFEPLNTWRFGQILKPGDVVFDVGANIGYFTALAAQRVGRSGRVYAFEPHPVNFPILEKMVADNDLRMVTPLALGLDRTDGTGVVHMADQIAYPNRTASMVGSSEGAIRATVPTRSIDSFVKEHGIDHIDLLKIDVDGFEGRIILGAKETLAAGKVRHVIIEFNEHWLRESGIDGDEITRLLENGGMRDVSATDGWVVHLLGKTPDRHFAATGRGAPV